MGLQGAMDNLLLDRVGKASGELDDIGRLRLEAGSHFVFGAEGHELGRHWGSRQGVWR